MKVRILLSALVGSLLLFSLHISIVHACTGIRLSAKDGSAVYGRTMEWGTFDLNSRVAIIPRGYEFRGLTPDGYNGKKWKSKYGVIGLDLLGKDLLADGRNEKGLATGLFITQVLPATWSTIRITQIIQSQPLILSRLFFRSLPR